MDNTIAIDKMEYYRLRLTQEIMNYLVIGGVNNWEWYEESINFKEFYKFKCSLASELGLPAPYGSNED